MSLYERMRAALPREKFYKVSKVDGLKEVEFDSEETFVQYIKDNYEEADIFYIERVVSNAKTEWVFVLEDDVCVGYFESTAV